ncbi:MAG: hypothetical protein FWC33_05620, partial [Candidatus Bathyarchaeota archaeon]|nr:hypothetical protein [Candidatus Termiticorpusculum sp.]
MKKIDATINGKDFSDAAKYLEINIDGPIATFILILDNQSGASELLEEYQPVILGYDGNVLLRGYLENVLSDSDPAKPHAVKSKYVKVTGVNAAADLINLMLPQKAKFTDAHIGDIFNVGLLAAESEIVCNPNTDVFPVGTKGPIVKLIETANRYLVDIFEDSCERSSYIYVVNQDEKRLYSFPLSEVPNTGVMLYNLPKEKSNNIIEVNPNARIGDSIYNWVCVRAGNLSDHYTEETAKYLSTNNSSQINWGLSISDDYSVFAVGKASIKGSCNNAIHSWDGGDVIGNYGPQLRFDFPLFNCEKLDYSNISYENCSVYLSHNYTNSIASDKGFFVIIITDNLGRKMRWVTENISKFEWKKIDFVLGYNAPSEGKFAIGHPDRKWVLIDGATSFNWEIVSLAFEFHPNTYTSNPFSCDFWVDGLTFSSSDALEVFAIAEDKQSQQTKRKKMISLYRPDLKSQLAVQYVADAEAQSRTNAFRKYSLMCDIQPSLLYANLLCYVLAPQYHIGSGLNPEICRILSIKHVVFPGEPEGHGFDALSFVEVVRHNGGQNINAARLRRVGNPQNAINTGHENRLVTLENKAGGGSGGSGGGGGAGGSWSGGDVS